MKNRKFWCVSLCLFLVFAGANQLQAQDTVDLVVLLDSSQSMFAYYDEVVEFVVTGIVSEYMRFGDTFHLISFADTTQIEIAQTLRTEQDLRAALARLYLLYPFGKSTDLITALRNTYQYINDLPQSNRKFLVIITDGMHMPAINSPFVNFSSDDVKAELLKTASRFREQGWLIKIIQIPFLDRELTETANQSGSGFSSSKEESISPGSGNYLTDIASSMGSGSTIFQQDKAAETVRAVIKLPQISIPDNLGRRRYSFKLPVTIRNEAQEEIVIELTALIADGTSDILKSKTIARIPALTDQIVNLKVQIPKNWIPGFRVLRLEPRFADNLRVNPPVSSSTIELYTSPVFDFFDNTLTVMIFIILLALALILVFLAIHFGRTIHQRTDGTVVETVMDSANTVRPADSGIVKKSQESDKLVKPGYTDPFAAYAATKNSQSKNDITALTSSQTIIADAGKQSSFGTQKPDTLVPLQAKTNTGADSLLAGKKATTLGAADSLSSWTSRDKEGLLLTKHANEANRVANYKPSGLQQSHATHIVKPGTIRLEFVVDGQTRAVGRRNIKTLYAGSKKTIGGGSRDDFFVFLVPVSPTIAEVYYNGDHLIVVPLKTDLFAHGNVAFPLNFGESFELLSKKGRMLSGHFDYYIPPVDKLNKLLHCIESPGIDSLLEGLMVTETDTHTL